MRTTNRRRTAGEGAVVRALAAAALLLPSTVMAANPLAGQKFYVDPYSEPKQQADAWRATRPADAAQMDKVASQPQAYWFGDWNADVRYSVDKRVTTIKSAGALPVLVAYNIPDRDCDGWSSGGASSPDAYRAWIRAFATGINGRRAVVILEPDALGLLDRCNPGTSDQEVQLGLLVDAVQVLKAQPAVSVYIDAANSGWVAADVMASRLRAAGVMQADGFAVNVSNFKSTADEIARGRAISALVGWKHFVLDTSRNGIGAGATWCNPEGRALGTPVSAVTDDPLVDAFLWIKRPGESDGICNGGPTAGTFWSDYALGLAIRSTWEIDDPTMRVGNAQAVEDSATDAVFTITLSAPTQRPVTVSYSTVTTVATGDVDFIPTAGTLTFAPGVTLQTVTVTVRGDALYEGNETFAMQLREPLHARFSRSRGTATIVEDDVMPAMHFSSPSVLEGGSGSLLAYFKVRLSAPSAIPVTVSYQTFDGNAVAGSDYVAAAGTLTFAPGAIARNVAVTIKGDTQVEPNESFSLTLSTPVGATLASPTGNAVIRNDDMP